MDRLRHRDRLLSLKYSTVEACFSVPMLNLTLSNFPFVVAFAAKVLGWQAGTVGLMAALPHVCNFLQPIFVAGLSKRLSKFQMLLFTFSIGGLAWASAGTLPFLGNARGTAFTVILVLGTLASSVSTVAWSAAISEVVPERLSGRYFAKRNLIFGAWTLIAVMVAGQIVEWRGNSLAAFAAVFCLAGFSRLMGLFFLTRMRFPAVVMAPQAHSLALSDLFSVMRNRNYLALCSFIGIWGLLLNAAMPFYTVYLVDSLKLGIGTVVKLTTLASLGGLVTLKAWGRLSDRFGNRPVLQVVATIWTLTALVMWSLVRPGFTWHLYVGYFVVGSMTAGFQLTQFNLMVRLAPAQERQAYVAVFLALTSLLTAAGPVVGGQILKFAPRQFGEFLGQPFLSFQWLFILAALGGMLATALVRRVHEPAEQPAINVWREMRGMRTFNPMLSAMSVGELLLTPRGLVALAQRSLRSVRLQVKALEDVGEEIVSGGREVLSKTPGRKK
jgi:MFS family permease